MCLFRQCSSNHANYATISLLNNYNKQIRRYYISHATFSNIRVNTGDIIKASLHISVRMNTSNELYKLPMNKCKFLSAVNLVLYQSLGLPTVLRETIFKKKISIKQKKQINYLF